jgi:hypothetical protein
MLTTLAQAWVAQNLSWLQQIFKQWDRVELTVVHDEQKRCIGYEYILHEATVNTALGAPASIPPMIKGALCSGTTKSGGPCKNPGKNAGNRCYAHPWPLQAVAIAAGTRVPRMIISTAGGPDNHLRGPIAWDQLLFDHTHQALDYLATPPLDFKTAYLVLNSFINTWQDQYGPVLNFNIICQHGAIRASSQWPIERLRSQLKYTGPWRTTRGEQVALQGALVGDYTPGIWM